MHETIEKYLALARSAVGMDLAWLSEHTGPDQVLRELDGEARAFNVQKDDALPLEGSFCIRVLSDRLPPVIPDTAENPVTAALAVTEQLGIGSYVGSPVRLPDGSLYGMLCCISRGPTRGLKDSQVRLLEAIGAALGEELAAQGAARENPDPVIEQVFRALRGEGMQVVVQPIVQLSTMRPVGAEALTRFGPPPRRPDLVFAEAAALGMGVRLELAAIRAALLLLDELPAEVYLSVNASPDTIMSAELADTLSGADPRRLVVEVTEHSSVAEYDALLASMDVLRGRGVRIAVDDAGAGYASFQHILSLRPDIIKFDRALVTGLDTDPARNALVGSLVSFAERIGATLVAEGVETGGELDSLARLGVACGQGYLFARPAPPPLGEIQVRPRVHQRVDEAGEPEGEVGFQEAVGAILRDVAARTGLEASYVSIWDAKAETLAYRVVYDPGGMGIRVGREVPYRETPCYHCRSAGVLWTSDVEGDIPAAAALLPDGTTVGTFLSVPVLDAAGGMIGTLCAIGRDRRYLGDPVLAHVQLQANRVAQLVRRAA